MAETNNNNNSVELINVSKTYKVYERSSASPLDKILNVLRGSKAKSFNALENINLNIKPKIIFIETFAKINTPSLTGRAVYPIADVFYIQWPELKSYYPKARYVGKLY